jgi:predicted flap endonuclease-1-like 5' DNA nuclease
LKAIIDWFTPPRRKAIYGLVAAGAVALTAFGIITDEQLAQWTQSASGVIAALATFMAFLNTGGQ